MTNDEGMTKHECPNSLSPEWGKDPTVEEKERVYDLEERTAKFGESVINFCRKIQGSPINSPLVSQLVRAATSVGANYCEADDAVSRREFRNIIGTCRKESRETKHWLRMVALAVPDLSPEARVLWREARELHLIFCKIFRNVNG